MTLLSQVRRQHRMLEAQGSAIAGEVIEGIAQLYKIEKQVRGSLPDERVVLRPQQSKPILDSLEDWLSKQLTHISRKSPLAGAIRYALTRIPKVRPFYPLCIG